MKGDSPSVEQTGDCNIFSKTSEFLYIILQRGQIESKLFKNQGTLVKMQFIMLFPNSKGFKI